MAIVETFSKCLETPYLRQDPEAPARVPGLLALAADRLDAAAAIDEGAPGDAADVSLLAYEAMFACIRALVYAHGYREAGLRCLLLACEALYVRPGTLDAAHLHAFQRVQGLTLPPAESLAAASALVRRALAILQP
jgi:hypothetical protein